MNNKSELVIGVLGGMGTYATINLFKQYAKVFSAEKEWERPRIIIDNRCTMPSRVRAYLYNEDVNRLVNEMSESLQNLSNAGCNKLILACNTSHLFLPEIYKKVPDIEKKMIHIIDTCVEKICEDNMKNVFLLGSEGTIESQVYQKKLEKNKIKCIVPNSLEYGNLRKCIEAVKQNKYTDEVKKIFIELVERYDSCILGCTELPILYDLYKDDIKTQNIYDPLLLGLLKLKGEFYCE